MKAKKTKVLHVAATTTGGVGQVVLDLLKYHNREGFDVAVAFGAGYWLDREFAALDAPRYLLPLTRKVSLWSTIKSIIILHRLIKKEGFDIVHTHTSIGGLVGRIAAWTAGVPVVIFHVHALASHPYQTPLKRWFFWVVERFLDKLTDHYISVSEDYKRLGSESGLFAASKVDTIINGVEASPFDLQSAPAVNRELRRQLDILPESFVVGTVTRLEPQKAVHLLLEGFSRLAEKCPDCLLVIAGDGYLREELQQLGEELGIGQKVLFLGWREDVRELLTLFDVFAMSSRWEGLPVAILEAMSSHCPVVSTAVGGIPEMIETEYDGLLVPPEDAKALGEALLCMYQDRSFAERLAENASSSFEMKFSVTRMVEQHESLYHRLMLGGRQRIKCELSGC